MHSHLTVTTAIESHRATVVIDETSYLEDGTPVSDAVAAATGVAEAASFMAFCATPCLTPADVQAKIDYLLNEHVGMRSTPLECLGHEEYGAWDTFEAFIRSLALPALAVAA